LFFGQKKSGGTDDMDAVAVLTNDEQISNFSHQACTMEMYGHCVKKYGHLVKFKSQQTRIGSAPGR